MAPKLDPRSPLFWKKSKAVCSMLQQPPPITDSLQSNHSNHHGLNGDVWQVKMAQKGHLSCKNCTAILSFVLQLCLGDNLQPTTDTNWLKDHLASHPASFSITKMCLNYKENLVYSIGSRGKKVRVNRSVPFSMERFVFDGTKVKDPLKDLGITVERNELYRG